MRKHKSKLYVSNGGHRRDTKKKLSNKNIKKTKKTKKNRYVRRHRKKKNMVGGNFPITYRCLNMDKKNFKQGKLAAELKYWLKEEVCNSWVTKGAPENTYGKRKVYNWVTTGSNWRQYGRYMSTAMDLEKLKSSQCNPFKVIVSFDLDELGVTKADNMEHKDNVYYPMYDKEFIYNESNKDFVDKCIKEKKVYKDCRPLYIGEALINAHNIGEIVISKTDIPLANATIVYEGFLTGVPPPAHYNGGLIGKTLEWLLHNSNYYLPKISQMDEVYKFFYCKPSIAKKNCPDNIYKCPSTECKKFSGDVLHSIHIGKCNTEGCKCIAPSTLYYYSELYHSETILYNILTPLYQANPYQHVNFTDYRMKYPNWF